MVANSIGLFLLIALVEGGIFSLPARIAVIKRYAMSSRSQRWVVIVGLSMATAVVNYTWISWTYASIEVLFATTISHVCWMADDDCNPEEQAFAIAFNLDYELKDELINEIAVRRFTLYSGENCLLNNTEVCIALNRYYAQHEEWQSRRQYERSFSDLLTGFFAVGVFLSPSFFTGYIVYRITRDGRKQKRSSLP